MIPEDYSVAVPGQPVMGYGHDYPKQVPKPQEMNNGVALPVHTS